jgi:hypothetical protein
MPRDLKTEADLFEDQRRFVREICEKKTVYLALMMGTGKTVIGLTAAKQLLESWRACQVLVVAPMRVAESTWPDEIREWAHLRDLQFSVITGTPEARERAARRRVPIHIVNRENVVWLRRFWGDDWPYDVLLYDEASRLKGGRKRTKPAKKARKDGGLPKPQLSEFGALCEVRPKLQYVVEFSGTPNPNGLPDLWGPLYLLDGGERLGRTRTAFLDRWFIKGFNGWSYEPRDGAFREIAGRVRDIMLSAPDPMSDTPISKAVYATLPAKALAEYHKFRRTLVAEPWDVRASSAGVLANKLLQFANGSIYDESRAAKFVHDEKLAALESIIEEANGEPILVFYGFQFDKTAICKRFKHAEVFGKDPTFVARWNAGKIPLALAHPACLHPDTLVLTEHRGWVRLVDVRKSDCVFDGVDFVSHKGCVSSGVRPVIQKFGITCTPDHLFLIDDKWVEASNVSDSGSSAGKARYAYAGNDNRISSLLSLWNRIAPVSPKRAPQQSGGPGAVPGMPTGNLSPHDGYSPIPDMARNGGQNLQRQVPRLSPLRGAGDNRGPEMARLRELLVRYARRVFRRSNDRADRQQQGILQGELLLGHQRGATVEQEVHEVRKFLRAECAPSRVLPAGRSHARRDYAIPGQARDGGGRLSGIPIVDIPDRTQVSQEVFDLIDCGPRRRFAVRNAGGEIFIVHNSAGHGLNLQYGGRIAVWYGLTWNLEYYLQANKRLHRRGQTRTVYLYHILARNTIDERVYGLLPEKARTQNRLLQATIADFIRARTGGGAGVSPLEFDILEREAAQDAILKEFLAELKA